MKPKLYFIGRRDWYGPCYVWSYTPEPSMPLIWEKVETFWAIPDASDDASAPPS